MYCVRMAGASARRDSAPPSFVRLAGHPLRWRLLNELARSDHQVHELCDLLDRPQSLVSYHLGRLRAGMLVSMRRSSADQREAYYSIDLAHCRKLLTETGDALHPGLLRPPSLGDRARRSALASTRVLFLCTGNSARSQIAEALLEHASAGAVSAISAGSNPKPLHPNAVRVMHEQGLDVGDRRSKHLSEVSAHHFDYVVSLCDRVREVCPEFPGADVMHWSVPDPAREGDSDSETYPAFQRTATELATRIAFLLARIEYTRHPAGDPEHA